MITPSHLSAVSTAQEQKEAVSVLQHQQQIAYGMPLATRVGSRLSRAAALVMELSIIRWMPTLLLVPVLAL